MSYKLKTQLNDTSVRNFLESIQDSQKWVDCLEILELFERVSGYEGKMWWKNIIGFWTYTYKYASGHTWDWMRTGFSPRAW